MVNDVRDTATLQWYKRVMPAVLLLPMISLISFTTHADELPSIAKRAESGEGFVPPFKLDCITRPGKRKTLGERFEMLASSGDQGHDEHAQHRRMMISNDYQLHTADYTIPDVQLISHRGEKGRLPELLDTDKPVMLNFIFTTCTTICPVLSASFHQVQEIMGDESDSISMISITIDPDYDTPEQLMKYAQKFKAGNQWQFYTGTYNDVVKVEKAFDIFRGSKMNHEPITLIRKQNEQSWVRISGLASAEDIVREYRKTITAGK
ncbi:MAG: SCO family protein [Candidatus Thiodiazotropha sp.]